MSQDILERFGKYFLLDRIGSGGMAGIFRARPASTGANGRIMVVKRMLPHVANDPVFLNMFKAEIQICMGLNHPNIVQIHDFGEVAGQAYLAMEYMEGNNLKELIVAYSNENERVPIEMALSIVEQAASGLRYAHTFENTATGERFNLIHRDISPQNILISYEGHLKVIDFGIAKAEVHSSDTTQEGIIKGKVGYLSPEQISQKNVDARADIFALGIVLWELLTGEKLFKLPGKSDLAVLQMIQNCDGFVMPPSSVNAKIPPALDKIVMRALAQNPDHRYQTAEEFQAALIEYITATYPGYGAADISKALREMFKDKIAKDRERLQELNQKAQIALSSMKLRVAEPPPLVGVAPTGTVTISAATLLPVSGFAKLTRGRLAGALLYLLTIAFLKMDLKYSFLERIRASSDDARVNAIVNRKKTVARRTASPDAAVSHGEFAPTRHP